MTCVVLLQNPDLLGLLMLWRIAASARQGELCEFMDNLRAREQPIGQEGADEVEGIESDDSSLWEGEGTMVPP